MKMYDEPEIRPEDHSYRVAETQDYWVDIVVMIFNHRVVMTPKSDPMVYDAGWCYPDMLSAVAAVRAWDFPTEQEPVGFIKRVGLRRDDIVLA